MKRLSYKIAALLLIGLFTLPFIGSTTPNYIYRDQVAVIVYHHLSDTAKSSVTITPELFREQLSYLKKRGFQFITLDQFKYFMAGGSVPDNAVLVTFDDGYKSFYDVGYPILKELNIPAVNFVITGTLHDPNGGNIPFLDDKTVKEMAAGKDDVIDFQCHSDQLHSQLNGVALLTARLSANGVPESETAYRQRIAADTQACKNKLLADGEPQVDAYAYPFGSFDAKSASLIGQSGIRYAFTVVSEMATREDDPLQIPRITAGNPSITPQELERTIIRKIVDLNQTFGYVPFRESVGQVGGTMIQDKDGTINFYNHGKHWKIQPGSSVVYLGDQTVPLEHPLEQKGRKTYIDFGDLQRVMDIHMVYNPISKTFSERLTPFKQRE